MWNFALFSSSIQINIFPDCKIRSLECFNDRQSRNFFRQIVCFHELVELTSCKLSTLPEAISLGGSHHRNKNENQAIYGVPHRDMFHFKFYLMLFCEIFCLFCKQANFVEQKKMLQRERDQINFPWSLLNWAVQAVHSYLRFSRLHTAFM